MPADASSPLASIARRIKQWGAELGFDAVGVSDCDLGRHETRLLAWLNDGFHGEMGYMARHGSKRSRPAALRPGTVRVISARIDYLPPDARPGAETLANPTLGYISRYALGRDYHRPVRKRLDRLARRIAREAAPHGWRVFSDSAPVLERALAEKAGLGWIGKSANLIDQRRGSWFFLGEIYTDLPLPVDAPARDHCGSCRRCIDDCPTGAIVAPGQVDARRCISYLTIELRGAIPEPLRPLIGNRIYGCDDCQLVCPWNRFAQPTGNRDFRARNGLDAAPLTDLFAWSETEFLHRLDGSPIRRIGHERWLRNIAVALGNGPATTEAAAALRARLDHPSALVREHVAWALERLRAGRKTLANRIGHGISRNKPE